MAKINMAVMAGDPLSSLDKKVRVCLSNFTLWCFLLWSERMGSVIHVSCRGLFRFSEEGGYSLTDCF
jgi:hypothetical protein